MKNTEGIIKILIVDDSQVIRLLLQAIFNAEPDLEVIGAAKNGEEAVKMARLLKPDLITMDIRMPIMDGFEATENIRANEGSDFHLPIIAVTANAMSSDKQRCLDVGMDDYLKKPISPEAIRMMINRWTSLDLS